MRTGLRARRTNAHGIAHAARVAIVATGLNNGRTEGLNGKIRVITRRAYGFHNAQALIGLPSSPELLIPPPQIAVAARCETVPRDSLPSEHRSCPNGPSRWPAPPPAPARCSHCPPCEFDRLGLPRLAP